MVDALVVELELDAVDVERLARGERLGGDRNWSSAVQVLPAMEHLARVLVGDDLDVRSVDARAADVVAVPVAVDQVSHGLVGHLSDGADHVLAEQRRSVEHDDAVSGGDEHRVVCALRSHRRRRH